MPISMSKAEIDRIVCAKVTSLYSARAAELLSDTDDR